MRKKISNYQICAAKIWQRLGGSRDIKKRKKKKKCYFVVATLGLHRFLKSSFKNSREVELNLDVKIPLDGFFIQFILLQVFVCHLIYQKKKGQIHFGILLANIYWPNSSQRVWKCDGMHLQAWINQCLKTGKTQLNIAKSWQCHTISSDEGQNVELWLHLYHTLSKINGSPNVWCKLGCPGHRGILFLLSQHSRFPYVNLALHVLQIWRSVFTFSPLLLGFFLLSSDEGRRRRLKQGPKVFSNWTTPEDEGCFLEEKKTLSQSKQRSW